MFETLPQTSPEFSTWSWQQIEPYYNDLLQRPLTTATLDTWLTDWTRISALLDETSTNFTIATSVNTADEVTERRYKAFLDEIAPPMMSAEQKLKQKLIESGLEPAGFAVPLRKLRSDTALFREANIEPLNELRKLTLEYEKLSGARTIIWDGQEVPITQVYAVLEEPDRDRRELAWRARHTRINADTPALASLWRQMMTVRKQIAENVGFDNFRSYRWQQLYRFDYTPDDARQFHAAIEEVVVPAMRRLHEQRRQRMGVETLRPWDTDVDALNRPPLRPYQTIEDLETRTSAIFHRVDPRFGSYFDTMRAEHLLDLDSRANKAPGGYSVSLSVRRQPFIFTNAVGTHQDVQTLLHEGGHSFHTFESAPLPYLQQRHDDMVPIEFAEVASMGMELLASPYLTTEYGGFYTEAEAARACSDNLEKNVTMWPYTAMIDALQHWMYEHQDEAADVEACDNHWATLIDRFWPQLDWSGLDVEKRTFWRRQLHVFQIPFYYIEYGMAQLGAIQLWGNALQDQAAAVAAYRQALALGGTATLPELYKAAGVKFAFDVPTLRSAVELIESQLARLEPLANQ